MSVPRRNVGTGTLEDCYLHFQAYNLVCMMHSCVIYLHNFVSGIPKIPFNSVQMCLCTEPARHSHLEKPLVSSHKMRVLLYPYHLTFSAQRLKPAQVCISKLTVVPNFTRN